MSSRKRIQKPKARRSNVNYTIGELRRDAQEGNRMVMRNLGAIQARRILVDWDDAA